MTLFCDAPFKKQTPMVLNFNKNQNVINLSEINKYHRDISQVQVLSHSIHPSITKWQKPKKEILISLQEDRQKNL